MSSTVEAESKIPLQGREHLPKHRPVTVRVVRTGIVGLAGIIGAVAVTAFAAGLAAGTSGQYREFIMQMTGGKEGGGIVQTIALWPDRAGADTPTTGDRIAALKATFDASAEDGRTALDSYRDQAQRMIKMRHSLAQARSACVDAAGRSHRGEEALDALRRVIASAIVACSNEGRHTEGTEP